MEKSGLVGSTVIVRVGGLGSELPVASITVSEIVYVPGVLNVTFPGFCAVDVAGEPPGRPRSTRSTGACAEVDRASCGNRHIAGRCCNRPCWRNEE
jgi:hypothetical protein